MRIKKRKKILIQEELERSIVHGLACEWETALWVLDSSHRRLMRKPFFSLQNMKDKWGFWSAEKREICLSRDLVLKHTWDTVREVLLHEMAHQFSYEVLGAYNQPPHGPDFQRACYLLRANPKASGKYCPLDKRISNESVGLEDKIMLKVKKLMALAESQNQHEAEAAMAKAYELIAKHNLDLLMREEKRDFISVFVGKPALRHFREQYHLARLLQDFYFVHGLWVSAYVLEKGKMGRVLEISGTLKNIQLASYVYEFVQHFIDSQWHGYDKDMALKRCRKTDFAVGILEGFRSKLELQVSERKKSEDRLDIVTIEDPLLLKHVAYKYPYTVTFRRKVSNQDESILKDGMRVGRRLVISKGITEKSKSRTLLIGNKRAN